MPWWLSGISHHMSGYSAVMFTGYAGISYQYGLTSMVTWSLPIAIGIGIGAKLFAPGSTGSAHVCTWHRRWST